MAEGMTKARELRERRANLVEQQRAIVNEPAGENGALSAEQRETFDRIDADIVALRADIDRIERHEERERELSQGNGARTVEDGSPREPESRERKPDLNAAFRAWALDGEYASDEYRATDPDARGGFRVPMFNTSERSQYLSQRAQAAGTDADGGYTVPQGFRAVLEDALLAFGGVRQARVTVLRTASGNQLEIPTLDDTANKGVRLAENTADTEQDMTFGQAVLDAYKYTSKIIRVSKELLQDSAFDFNSLVGAKLAERIARITATEFTTGTGTSQPEGVVTGATLGKTSATGNVATIDTDDLVDLFHSVDPAYRAMAEWMMSDAGAKMVRKKKDADNQYLWQPGLQAGQPDRILGRPVRINEEVADPAASAKSILFGDFSKFYIRDVLDVSLVRLVERYAEFHQVGFVAISRHDSVLVDAGTNPIKYLQHPAS